MFYRLTDYIHFARMYGRNRRRQRVWGKLYEDAVRSGAFKLPAATVVQLIPTEACNLRCPFCNQWGENGYFFDGVRRVQHMNVEGLTALMRGLSPRGRRLRGRCYPSRRVTGRPTEGAHASAHPRFGRPDL